MTDSAGTADIDALRDALRAVLPAWGLSPEARLTLLGVSENVTFRADDPTGAAPAAGSPSGTASVVLRIHRPGYHSRAEIESEHAWIDALRAEGVVATPAPLRTRTGARVAALPHGAGTRAVAAFAFMTGTEPTPGAALTEGFGLLGGISARLHAHAMRWRPPPGFARKTWNVETTIGDAPHWGPWRAGLGLDAAGTRLLDRCAGALRRRLDAFGSGPDRFGLIHADLRLANLLADGDRLGVIDFDDCGFGWFVYDFAAAVSFFETEPYVPDLAAAWVAGYRSVAPLSAAAAAMIPTFVMLRRLLLTAWIASHADTPTARNAGLADYTAGTLSLAERWLTDDA